MSKILVVGSFVMDQIATTEVVPREGQTVLGKTFSKAPGGKGANQAVQMARLGAKVTMFGKLGKDSNGAEMVEVCKKAGIDTSHIVYDSSVASGCSMLILQEKPGQATENRIIVIPGANMTITEEDIAFLESEIKEYDLVVLQLEIPMAINEKVAKIAKANGVPVFLNCAPSAPLSDEFLSCLTYISPNESEAEDLTGIKIKREGTDVDFETVKDVAKALQEKGVEKVLLTLGRAGAAYLSGEDLFFSPSVGGDAVDPTAAGDSFIGAFCSAICASVNVEDALKFANTTAGITVSRMGAMPSLPTLEEVLEAYSGNKAALFELIKGGENG